MKKDNKLYWKTATEPVENIVVRLVLATYADNDNLYDIFYGRYKGEKENAILRAYIDAAPRENFDDIFDAIDNFVYFNNRRND